MGVLLYLIGVKDNQPTLRRDMQQLFDDATVVDFACSLMVSSVEQSHGRTDERIVHAIRVPADHPQRELWRDLKPPDVYELWKW